MTVKMLLAFAVLGAGVATPVAFAQAQPPQYASAQCASGALGCVDSNSFMSGLQAPYDMRCQPGFIPEVYPTGSGFRCLAVNGVESYPKP